MQSFINAVTAFICLSFPAWAQTSQEVAGAYRLEYETQESNGVKQKSTLTALLDVDRQGVIAS